MSSIRMIVVALSAFLFAAPTWGDQDVNANPKANQPAEVVAEKCEHGVKKTVCTRCNPKLEPVFKAKNDWCAEHTRPESQCVICHPELGKQGVK